MGKLEVISKKDIIRLGGKRLELDNQNRLQRLYLLSLILSCDFFGEGLEGSKNMSILTCGT